MNKIYTRSGDKGETSLADGERRSKSDLRVRTYGGIDELNSVIGLAGSLMADSCQKDMTRTIQTELLNIGSMYATPGKSDLDFDPEEAATRLEKWIDGLVKDLPKLEGFILPGGGETGARLHLARTVCRRVERDAVELAADPAESVPGGALKYLNRLSDFLYAWARWVNHTEGCQELLWKDRR